MAEKIVLYTKDRSLKKELSGQLPRGYSLERPDKTPVQSIVFYDLDSMRSGGIKELSENNPVVALTKHRHTETVMEAVSYGAYEVIQRPVKKDSLARLLDELISFRQEITETIDMTDPFPAPTCAIVGNSPIIMDVCKKLARLSQVEVPVLVTGETGTGKELIAEAIAQLSSRFGKPFVVVNCAAVPEALLESELFGFEKGSFTGAVAPKEGMLKIADGGCVFFDEVGELPLSLQGKLLRFLQTQTFYPIGSTKELQVDVRVISATNRNLSAMVREGKFREDLYHRIRVTTIEIPPLRERKKDFIPLIHFFLDRYRHTAQRQIKGISKAFLKKLVSYDWPGNIRELENNIRSAIALSKAHYLTTFELKGIEAHVRQAQTPEETIAAAVVPYLKNAIEKKEKNIYDRLIGEIDRAALQYILSHTHDNQSEAARLLGINRLTLRKKLQG
ncbi:MAG: sigma-54-dependent Fis family transcriptional regulator [Nitrospirae bacterium]|nr:MAG: sigma-54-dependent Fis family transcriptional regulator [Nitrospirota bacterium]